MFIIFDLDDTLIDTSECITPVKLEKALQHMIAEGLKIKNFNEALDLLLRLDLTADSAKSALEEFIEINDFDPRFLPIGLKEIYHIFSDDIPVFAVEGASVVLPELRYEHQMAIVTVGQESHQRWKLEKAGIDSSLFCRILILEERNKREHYRLLVQEMGVSPREVVVCGDRISTDLTPARQLGYGTIHMKKGRGLHASSRSDPVDYTANSLFQVQKILLDMRIKTSFG